MADLVYQQLSDHAKTIIDDNVDRKKVAFGHEQLRFLNTFDLMKRRDCPFPYYLKEPLLCEVTYDEDNEDGKKQSIRGTMQLVTDANGHYNRIMVQTDKSDLVLSIDQVIRINPIKE
ncbi:hypothetical protein [Heliophilum fasciatum]|uniref:YolD-like protein n=1 Tax=Heliophilum fasciatum TaxID=35700 RepID=A0A4R2R985_9FIRM|nr:hypothetical protein [Heliophilum fasciatum]MCW2279469.1 hypothetical protein [Heliophilum fasciatum]TCP59780.1 hypothetical protein EDD73_1494 [Heliophilum fasciatum]